MGGPEFIDGHFMSDSDLTDLDHFPSDTEPVARICPVCGSRNIIKTDADNTDFDTIINGYRCNKCSSDFSYTYWVKAIVIRKDGRFNKED